LERVELRREATADAQAASAWIAPGRGGMITGWRAAGRDLLALDEETFTDLGANVRGGIPVLFPAPGKLLRDIWTRGGRIGSMKQHGFARNEAFAVKSRAEDAITLRLESN